MQIELINNQRKTELDLKSIEKATSYIADKFDPDTGKSLNIIFVNDKEVKMLNKNHRDIDRVTDVLSFSYLDGLIEKDKDAYPSIIGEVYISPAIALKNALEQGEGWSLELEIILLIVHGILHIYGYDHEDNESRAVMYNIQNSLIFDIRNRNRDST